MHEFRRHWNKMLSMAEPAPGGCQQIAFATSWTAFPALPIVMRPKGDLTLPGTLRGMHDAIDAESKAKHTGSASAMLLFPKWLAIFPCLATRAVKG